MKAASLSSTILEQEKKSTRLFLYLFFIITLVSGIFTLIVEKRISSEINPGTPEIIIDEWIYFSTELVLLLIGYYLIKVNKSGLIRYIFLLVYLFVALVTELIIYSIYEMEYTSGSVMEIFFVLFTPIFLDKKYFWWVTLGLISKYLIVGLSLSIPKVIHPVTILVLISILTFIFLNKSLSYVKSIEKAYLQLAHNEKLAFMGQVATSIAHEIRNPLTSIKGFLQLQTLQSDVDSKHSSIMMDEIERINLIVNDLLVLGKPSSLSLKSKSIEVIINYVVRLTKNQATANGITYHVEFNSKNPYVLCDENRIKQVLINIFRNAIDAMPNGGNLEIIADNYSDEEICIICRDEGTGIPEEYIGRLQEAFFSTKEDGTGLGLMVSYRIIEEHGGRIEVESSPEKGTTFKIFLPSTDPKMR
ncbi:ATP-binding protein [Alkalihalobacillus sp. CinArs1]|uniref:ATP-binding protein n=1 Tax=Alkalihalobacillus sp. CinArs1 TaxID=2995314 RepID=UPI0022DE5284|nr:ATP-binding protein [Alkalihalobacillus sp. CinArs1]